MRVSRLEKVAERVYDTVIATSVVNCPQCRQQAVLASTEKGLFIACPHCHSIHMCVQEPVIP